MEVYTICGSMKYKKEMKKIAWDLEEKNNICIIQCVYNEDNGKNEEKNKVENKMSKELIERLANIHYKKIDLADGIYVVDINGYIGESTKKEIAYAISKNKKVIYHSKK